MKRDNSVDLDLIIELNNLDNEELIDAPISS